MPTRARAPRRSRRPAAAISRSDGTLARQASAALTTAFSRLPVAAPRHAAAAPAATGHPAAKRAAGGQGGVDLGGFAGLPWVLGRPSVIEHFVAVVPGVIWVALAVAFALAGVAAGVALRASRRVRRQADEFAAVAAAAHLDVLTDALNRRGFADAVERELARARRYDGSFVLAYFDVRGHKTVNDSEGHPAGDRLLKQVAGLLKESARESDVVGRIGGDEFALLLSGQSGSTADVVTSRIRARVAAQRRELGSSVPWDLTIGTAAYPIDGTTFDELVAAADRRLYEQRGIELVRSHRG